jgi:hypothetical protein
MHVPDGFLVWDIERRLKKLAEMQADKWDVETLIVQDLEILLKDTIVNPNVHNRATALKLYEQYMRFASNPPFSDEEEKELGI